MLTLREGTAVPPREGGGGSTVVGGGGSTVAGGGEGPEYQADQTVDDALSLTFDMGSPLEQPLTLLGQHARLRRR